MLKRLLMTFLTLLVIYSGILVGYKLNEPVDAGDAYSGIFANVLDYASLSDYTRSSGSSVIHYYFFCSENNNDCVYVRDTVIHQVRSETTFDPEKLLEYVDISELEKSLNVNRLKTEWNISSYPAFIACRVQNGNIIISNQLEWNPEQPISAEQLKAWLRLNELIDDN